MLLVTLTIATLVVLVLLPQYIDGYWLRFYTGMFMVAGLAQGLNIVAGFTRYPALGNVVFWGLGAYVGGIGMNLGLPFFAAVVLAGVSCGSLALALGVPFMRLRGSYFLMATIGLNEVIRQVITNFFTDHTGGGRGLRYPLMEGTVGYVYDYFYFTMLGLALGATLIAYLVRRSKLGMGMLAIGANEDAASVLGVPTTLFKGIAWAISAMVFGVFGVAYGYWNAYMDPATGFDIIYSVELFIVFLIGGPGLIAGPLLGALVVQGASEFVWSNFLDLHVGALGVLMIAAVLFLPRGILGALSDARSGLPGLIHRFRRDSSS